MYTLGYAFRPWTSTKAIADGASILRLHRARPPPSTASTSTIRFGHRVVRADWRARGRPLDGRRRAATGEPVHAALPRSCSLQRLLRLRRGLHADFPASSGFGGSRPPAALAADLDYAGKRVVVIGSGATAVTLVPAMAEQAAHVTMLQRSPTYIDARAGERPARRDADRAALPARPPTRWRLEERRRSACLLPARPAPARGVLKALLRKGRSQQLPRRLRRGDPLHAALQAVGPAAVPRARTVTCSRRSAQRQRRGRHRPDRRRSPRRHRAESAAELAADIVVTATGLQAAGHRRHASCRSTARRSTLPTRWPTRAMMLSGVPNFAFAVGYTNASWTLQGGPGRPSTTCRLLEHMDRTAPQVRPGHGDPSVTGRPPLIDLESGYVPRASASCRSRASARRGGCG